MESAHDSERLTLLFRECAPRVLAYAIRRGLSWEEAEDVVGEVFVVAARRFHEAPADPIPWLIRIARNVTYTALRTRRRFNAFMGGTVDCADVESQVEGIGAPSEDPVSDAVLARVTDKELAKALAQLYPAEREALLMVAWDGLTARQAAAVARCSYIAFCMRLHRARKKLMSKIGSSGD